MNSKMPRDIDFFVIEDAQPQFEYLCLSLKKLGYNGDIVHAKSISSGLKLIGLLEQSKTNIDIVICDMHLPDGKGIEILEKIRGTSFLSSKPFLVYTSDDDSNLIIELPFDAQGGRGSVSWDLVSRNGQSITSGVYLYSIEFEGGQYQRVIKKFTVIQ